MVLYRLWVVNILLCSVFFSNGFASTPHTGLSASFPVITKDPEYLHAYQMTGWYQPSSWKWGNIRIYMAASAGHWWVTNTDYHHSLNSYAISPMLRFYFANKTFFSPFLNLGIGLAYLTRTRLDDRNLGEHFAFQDQLGLGVSLGKKQQVSLIFSALHYSNGSLCRINAGITVPLMASLEIAW